MQLTPEEASAWIPIAYDVVALALSIYMLVYATILNSDANPLIIAGGLGLLGVPPARRLIAYGRERGNDDENQR